MVTQRGALDAHRALRAPDRRGQRGTHRGCDPLGAGVSSVVGLRVPRRRVDRPAWFDGWPGLVTVFALAAACTLLAIVLGWRGSDLPAQVFRSELVRRDGFVVWNSQWFGGHALLSYSVLSPLVGSLTGPLTLGAISGVAAAVLFERILRHAYGRTLWFPAIWFALGTVANLIVGRVTFGLGIAFGLAAVYALQHRRPVVAVAAALLCALSSPLAGAFLALAAVALACAERERRVTALAVAAGALAPIAVIGFLFPNPGTEPYEPWALAWDLGLCLALVIAAWRVRTVRWGAALYAIAAAGAFAVATPIGGNVSRLGQFVGGPLLACALLPARRIVLAALAVPLLIWQWYPAVDGIAYAHTDPSTRRSYYTPVVDYLDAQTGPIGRVEIPSTYRHWEAAYAAPTLLLARGWERQLDIAYDPIFYNQALNAASYHTWLAENGVKYVALPDARLDDSSLGERALLLGGLPYLEPIWHNAHWRVWRVRDFTGLTTGNATLTRLTPDGFTVNAPTTGDVTVRVRASSRWKVQDDKGCVTKDPLGWTVLRVTQPGPIEVTQSLRGTSCKDS
jgi:hypothetical protein